MSAVLDCPDAKTAVYDCLKRAVASSIRPRSDGKYLLASEAESISIFLFASVDSDTPSKGPVDEVFKCVVKYLVCSI